MLRLNKELRDCKTHRIYKQYNARGSYRIYSVRTPFCYAIGLLPYSVTAASAVVLIAAASAVVVLVTAASVVAGKNEDEDDEKNPVAVASVTKKHSVDLLSHLPLHNT